MTEVATVFLWLVLVGVFLLLLALSMAALFALVRGWLELRRRLTSTSNDFASALLKSPLVPGVSVIYVPESSSPEARARLRRLLDLHYGKHEVVLVLDGLDLAPWTEEFHLAAARRARYEQGFYVSLDPMKLVVIHQERAGEAEALNAGVSAAQYPIIACVDSEADFIPELLLHLIRPMLEDPDGVFAVCAMSLPAAAPGLAGCIGALESARVWLVRCAAFSSWGKLIPVPGSSFLLRRDVLIEAGGFRGSTADLFAHIYAGALAKSRATHTAFVARRVSWPAVPNSWNELRIRTQRDQRRLAALLQRYGWSAGRETRGLFIVRIVRPLLETIALVLAAAGFVLGWIPWSLAALVLIASAGMGTVISMAALVLREFADPSIGEPAKLAALFFAAIPENFGYRQIRNLWLIGASFQV
jgi:cellulose synthase/poly-beta-1,6-N-acetylglucosamine synthase-like glycosyltransferase